MENCEEKNEIWRLAVAYVESYLQELGFSKMYVEIPLKNPWLLYRADDLGFVESPEDVVNNEVNRTYLLNKELERTKDAESNIKHK